MIFKKELTKNLQKSWNVELLFPKSYKQKTRFDLISRRTVPLSRNMKYLTLRFSEVIKVSLFPSASM